MRLEKYEPTPWIFNLKHLPTIGQRRKRGELGLHHIHLLSSLCKMTPKELHVITNRCLRNLKSRGWILGISKLKMRRLLIRILFGNCLQIDVLTFHCVPGLVPVANKSDLLNNPIRTQYSRCPFNHVRVFQRSSFGSDCKIALCHSN